MSRNKKRYEIGLVSCNNGPTTSIITDREIPIGTVIETNKGNFKILEKSFFPGFYKVVEVEPVT